MLIGDADSGVDFCTKIKFGEHLAMRAFCASGADFGCFFYFNAAESLDWRGSRKNGSRKILFSKNLDTKI
jgi:hypothetical protein